MMTSGIVISGPYLAGAGLFFILSLRGGGGQHALTGGGPGASHHAERPCKSINIFFYYKIFLSIFFYVRST